MSDVGKITCLVTTGPRLPAEKRQNENLSSRRIVVALGSVAMIMDGVKGGPWDAEQVLLSGRVVFLGLVGLCIYMAPHRRKQFHGWGI